VEVAAGGKLVTVAMEGGTGSLRLPGTGAHFVLDPHARILRHDPAIAAWQEQEEEKATKAAAEAAAKG
jgi:hypothetical protein